MSWPTDGLPRFKATEPYAMGGGEMARGERQQWYQAEILDRAACHAIAEVVTGKRLSECAERLAIRATELEAEHAA